MSHHFQHSFQQSPVPLPSSIHLWLAYRCRRWAKLVGSWEETEQTSKPRRHSRTPVAISDPGPFRHFAPSQADQQWYIMSAFGYTFGLMGFGHVFHPFFPFSTSSCSRRAALSTRLRHRYPHSSRKLDQAPSTSCSSPGQYPNKPVGSATAIGLAQP